LLVLAGEWGLPPVPPYKPRRWEVKNIGSRDITLMALFASLYAVINVLQGLTVGNPSIYGPIQLRIADCLIALAALFGWPVIFGVSLGCVLANFYAFVSPVDVLLGPTANLVATVVVYRFRRKPLLGCILGAFPIGLIVGGGYLWWFFEPPDIFGLRLPAWMAMAISITLSSLVAVAIIGYSLLQALIRFGITGTSKKAAT